MCRNLDRPPPRTAFESGVMLTAIRLGNFKAFGATQRVPLKPLTLVFGPNSAGKSSLIHSLALAHEARRSGNLDAFRTDVGGTSIDLGGFRQYVFRRDPSHRVELAMEIDVAKLSGRLAEILAPIRTAAVSVNFGLPVDDHGYAPSDALTELESYKVEGDGSDLLRMSRRPGGNLRLDRLANEHPVFRQVLKAIVETGTTTSELRNEDQKVLDETIADLIPRLKVKAGRFLPDGIEGTSEQAESGAAEAMLFPVGRGSRSEDLAGAVRFYLPRILNELIGGLDHAVGEQIERLQYLGPLRSYPPRHLAFSEHDDANWHAGGGYAWDVLRRDWMVREQVNKWLGANWLKTNYQLVLRELVAMDQLDKPLSTAFETFEGDDQVLDLEVDYDDSSGEPSGQYPVIKDADEAISRIRTCIEMSDIDKLAELILVDQSTETVVSHRDVGIGISQVLPVLVSCYGLRDQIVAIEQPEIHLHPALQAELGDVFIQSALGDNNNAFVLETHSEHLILRIMRRIRDTADDRLPSGVPAVKPDDVSVIFVEPTKVGAIVRVLELDTDGEFTDSWPGGFFEEGFRERFT